MQKILFLLAITLFASALAFPQSQGSTIYVAVQSAEIKSSTGFFGNTVGALALGTAVTAIRENGKWIEVRAENSLSGWVAAASLSSRRITGSGHSASAGEIALAGKGFTPDVEVEYRKNGLDYSVVDTMENLNIPKEELLKFVTDGRLSKGE